MQKLLDEIAEFVNQCLGPLGSDGFSWNTIRDFIIQICATILLFIFVKHFFWNKVTDFLEAKQKIIDEAVTQSTESRDNALALEKEMKEKMAKAEDEVRLILSQAEATGNNIKESIVSEAKAEAKRRIDNASLEIENEILEKNDEIRRMIVDVAFSAAQKIISEEIDQSRYLEVVNQIIEGALKW